VVSLTLKKWRDDNNSKYEQKTFPIKLSPPPNVATKTISSLIETLGFTMGLYKTVKLPF